MTTSKLRRYCGRREKHEQHHTKNKNWDERARVRHGEGEGEGVGWGGRGNCHECEKYDDDGGMWQERDGGITR